MNDKLICPFCQQELRNIHPTYVICDNCRITGEDRLWQELITTRKALDVALKGLNDIIDSGGDGYWTAIKTKEQITALEQKDIK